jgi:hypothetical protein
MAPDLSVHALMECVRHHYPVGIPREDSRYEGSAESQRLKQRLHAAATDTSAWAGFIQRVEEDFTDCEVSDSPPRLLHPSYRCEVTLPGMRPWLDRTWEDSVVCMLSVLAPVYALYAHHWKDDRTERESWTRYPPLPPEFQSHEARLSSLIESTFGFTRLPNDVLFTPVPGIHPRPDRPERRAPWLVELLF